MKIDGVRILDSGWKQVSSSIYIELNELGRASQASAWGSNSNEGYLRYTTALNSEEYSFIFGEDYAHAFYEDWFTEAPKSIQVAFHKDKGNIFINLQQFNNYHSTKISYAMRFIGFGVQIALSASVGLSVGAEIVWYTYTDFSTGEKDNIQAGDYHCYLFGDAGISGSSKNDNNLLALKALIQEVCNNPSLLLNASTLGKKVAEGSTASVCIFAIYGNEAFHNPRDYKGGAKSISVTIKHVKGYVSVGDKTTVVGVGLDSSFAKLSCGGSSSYSGWVNDDELWFSGLPISDLRGTVKRSAEKLPGPSN